MKKITLLVFVLLCTVFPQTALGQEVHNDLQGTYRARVVEVVHSETRNIPGTDTEHIYQELTAELREGPHKGEMITVENDFLELNAGDRFFVDHLVRIDGRELYVVRTIDRLNSLLLLTLIFIAVVVLLGGWQGVRSLVALAGSIFVILYVLIPGLLKGYDPLLISFLVAAGILFAAIFLTHGFNRESTVAFSGTMIAVILTGLFALLAVHMTDLTGFATEEAVYLNLNTGGTLNFTGLLLGAIIIGALGVLDDIAVTQAAVVTELYSANRSMSPKEVFSRALRVGREHVGALVNTLVLAYTGAALPLLLLFNLSSSDFSQILNMEIFATEIVRTFVGSIGLIMTVPIVTLLAVYFLKDYVPKHEGHAHVHH